MRFAEQRTFGAQVGYTECKVERFPARIGVNCRGRDRGTVHSSGGRNRRYFRILRNDLGPKNRYAQLGFAK